MDCSSNHTWFSRDLPTVSSELVSQWGRWRKLRAPLLFYILFEAGFYARQNLDKIKKWDNLYVKLFQFQFSSPETVL